MEINGAQMFVKALQEEHVDTLFAYYMMWKESI